MLPIGHAAGGYITGTIAAFIARRKSRDYHRFQLLGVVGGMLPDIDLIVYYSIRQRFNLPNESNHHKWLTHTFPLYLLPGGLVTAWAFKNKRPRLAMDSAALTIGACTHLVQDMVGSGDGIQLLFPFSKRMYGVRILNAQDKEWLKRYLRDPISLVELSLIVIAFLIALKNRVG